MVFRFFAVLYFFSSHWVMAQNFHLRYTNLPADSVSVLRLHKVVDSLRERSSAEALAVANLGLQLADKANYNKGKTLMLESLAWLYYRNSDYSKALETIGRSIEISKQYQHNEVWARGLICIAAIHFEQEQYIQANRYFKEASAIALANNNEYTYGRSLNNIGFTYIQINELDSALAYTWETYRLAKQNQEDYILGFSCRNFGEIAEKRNSYNQALVHYNEGMEAANRSANNYLKASLLYRIGRVYAKINLFDRAAIALKQAIEISKKNSYKAELVKSLEYMAATTAGMGKFEDAFAYQKEFHHLQDSLKSVKSSEKFLVEQARLESKLKQAQIDLLTKDAVLQQEAFDKQKIVTYFFIGCVNLLVAFMVILWFNNKKLKEAKRALQKKNIEVKKQATQLAITNTTKDKLFSIISHDLRGPLGSLKSLMDLVGRKGITQEDFVSVSKKLRSNIDSVYDDLDNLLNWARTQLQGIKPEREMFNLHALVEQKIHLFEEVSNTKEVVLRNEISKEFYVLADRNQLGLVIRNIIANALKFSKERGIVTLRASYLRGELKITVDDRGVGMTTDEINKLFNLETHFSKKGTHNEKGVGLGLMLVKEFVESNNGAISLTSESGFGTKVTLTFKDQPEPVPFYHHKHAVA
jgi:two-component system sensor histidine kinase/response regulator